MATGEYVNERQQFGKALSQFQAIQRSLAQTVSNAAACSAAANYSSKAFGLDGDSWVAGAIGKIRAGEEAASIAALSHQLHSGIRFAGEHVLHRFTKQLWAWRDDFEGETE